MIGILKDLKSDEFMKASAMNKWCNAQMYANVASTSMAFKRAKLATC